MLNLTLQQKISAIVEECARVNPEIYSIQSSNRPVIKDGRAVLRPVRLADVLLAISEKQKEKEDLAKDTRSFWRSVNERLHLDVRGNFMEIDNMPIIRKGMVVYWNFRKDSIYDQEEATISFIHSVLKK